MTVPAHLTGLISVEDYISDDALVALEAAVPQVPTGFNWGGVNVWPKTVTVTLRFDEAEDVLTRAARIPCIFEAAMCLEVLVKNLRAERAGRR